MSECLHIHDSEGHDVGYVCMPGPFWYQPVVHRTSARKWERIGDAVETVAAAFQVLGHALEENRHQGYPRYNRAGILGVEREPSYYDPTLFYEVTIR